MGSKMPRIQVIFNPAADHGHARELGPHIRSWLSENGEVSWVETSRPGEAIELATRACEEGYDIIAAAGGDGTAQEVVNGLMRSGHGENSRAALGLIPIGSGNDFAWMLGVPRAHDRKTLEAILRHFYTGKTRWIDLGRIWGDSDHGRYFGNGVGIGFDGTVNIVSRKLSWARGFLMYTLAVLQTMLWYYRAPRAIVELDDQRIERPMMMISVSNGRRLGGGFYVTPQAEMDDGLFDICLVDQVRRIEMFMLIPLFMKGTQATNPHVHMMRAKHVTVRCEEGYAVHADGEIYATCAKALTMEILPCKLRVIV